MALGYNAEEGLNKPALDVDLRTLRPVLECARLRAEYAGPFFVEQPQEMYTEENERLSWKLVQVTSLRVAILVSALDLPAWSIKARQP